MTDLSTPLLPQLLPQLLFGAVAGVVLGAVFYAGLWATIRRASRASRPWSWFMASFVLRIALAGGGFLLLARQGLWPLVGALVGFVAAKPLVTRVILRRTEAG